MIDPTIDSNASAVKSFHLEIHRLSSMKFRERGSHALGVYTEQDTSRMETARVNGAKGKSRHKNKSKIYLDERNVNW